MDHTIAGPFPWGGVLRRCAVERLDLAAFLADADASVVLFQAARLGQVFREDPDLEITADLFTALDAESRLRQGLDPFQRNRRLATDARSCLGGHRSSSW